MNRGKRTTRYAAGTATNPTAIKNLYIYGGAIWAIIYFFAGLSNAGTFPEAVNVLMNVYIMKLFGWPWDEFLLADNLGAFLRSHLQTWAAGWLTATVKYGLNS